MRRNLRLDWRALALLGALLSIIIEWPGLLVYAMPTIFLPVTTHAQQQQQPQSNAMAATALLQHLAAPATSPLEEPAVNLIKEAFQNQTKINNNYNRTNSNNATSDSQSVNDNFYNNNTTNNNHNHNNNNNNNSSRNSSNNSSESVTSAAPLQRPQQQQENKKQEQQFVHSSGSYKNDPGGGVRQLAESARNNAHREMAVASTARAEPTQAQAQTEAAEVEFKAKVAAESESTPTISYSENSISNKYENHNTVSEVDADVVDDNVNASDTRTFLAIETATANAAHYDEQLKSTITAEIDDADAAAGSDHSEKGSNDIISSSSSSSSTVPSTSATRSTHKSLSVQSLKYAARLAKQKSVVAAGNGGSDSDSEDNDYDELSVAAADSSSDDLSSFTFASSHHTAILLSRTERSIRANGHGRNHGQNGRGNIVRRSSDSARGSKMKRLNIAKYSNLDRNERSTISELSGPSRKVHLFIKNHLLQLLPDGTINGTHDDQSDYTILQRSTVDVGRIKIQGVATCLYLCMDACGTVYSSKDFTDDCVFNENMEQHNYNTYSSTYNSNVQRIYYLALNRTGGPRKLERLNGKSLGKLATYTNALTYMVPQERVEQLIAKNFGENRIKHGIRQLCDTGKPLIELIDDKNFKARPECNPNISSNRKKLSNSLANSNSGSVSSSSSSRSRSRSSNGQLLNNVPAANDKTSNSAVTNSNSNSHSHSSSHSGSDYSASSSISNSQAIATNNGHTSSKQSSHSNSSDHVASASTTHHQQQPHHQKKKKKRRKCRPYENEDVHNCQRSPQALRRRGSYNNTKKCREQLQWQQQQTLDATARGERVSVQLPLPPACVRKGGGGLKKNGGNKKGRNQNNNNNGNNGLGPLNRRGKKLNANGRQAGNGNGGGGGGGGGGVDGGNRNGRGNRKRAKIGAAGPKKNKKNGGKTTSTTSTTTTTTTTTTVRPTLASILGVESTTSSDMALQPTTALNVNSDESIDPQAGAEATSARGEREREQRNVHYTNSMELEEEDATEGGSSQEDSTEAESAASVEEDASDENDADETYDDAEMAATGGASAAAAPSSNHMQGGGGGDTQTQLIGGADDMLYYDQLDFIPIGLWELFALLWITIWCIHMRI